MDRRTIVTKLNRVFSEASKESKRFSLVWLEGAGIGGLHCSRQYILHVQAHHKIESRTQEIEKLVYFLDEKAKEEFKDIPRIVLHTRDEDVDCDSRHIVYDEEAACS